MSIMNLITSENLEEMKNRLFQTEEKISKGQASNEEIRFLSEVLNNTVDYSDLFKVPGETEYEFNAKTNYQALGSLLGELQELTTKDIKGILAKSDSLVKISGSYNRIVRKSMDIRLRAAKRKPFKKELELFLELLDKNLKLTEVYTKKWCR